MTRLNTHGHGPLTSTITEGRELLNYDTRSMFSTVILIKHCFITLFSIILISMIHFRWKILYTRKRFMQIKKKTFVNLCGSMNTLGVHILLYWTKTCYFQCHKHSVTLLTYGNVFPSPAPRPPPPPPPPPICKRQVGDDPPFGGTCLLTVHHQAPNKPWCDRRVLKWLLQSPFLWLNTHVYSPGTS